MKPNVALTIASGFSVLLFTFHLADDIVRGYEKGVLWNLTAIPIAVLWLCGAALVLGERRSGYAIVLLLSLLAIGVPIIHFKNPAGFAGSRVANTDGAFFFVWTLLASGVTSLFSVILAARGLWGLRARRAG